MKRNLRFATWFVAGALAIALSVSALPESGPASWLRLYEGENYGAFFDIVSADDQHVLVTGTTFHSQTKTELGDVLVAMLTLDGDIVWEKTYGGARTDQGFYIERMANGGYLVLGETDSMGAGDRDLYLLKLGPDGTLLEESTFGGAGTEWAKDMIALAEGGFLLLGESDSFNEDFDVFIVRLASAGSELWRTTLDTGRSESGTAVLEAENGDLLVLAVISYDGGSSEAYRDSRLFRLTASGEVLWSSLLRGENKQAGDAMAWTSDGDLVIAGLSEDLSSRVSLYDFWLARVDASTGDLLWSTVEGSQYGDDYGIAMSEEHDGSFLVAGLGPAFPILSFTETGTVEWLTSAATDLGIYSGFAVLSLNDGSYLIPGFKYLQRVGDAFDAVLLRFSR
jgi:outer membrane protein assembly factor BamB